MSKKTYIIIIVIILGFGLGITFYQKGLFSKKTPTSPSQMPSQTPTLPQNTDSGAKPQLEPQIVNYADSGYMPNTVKIKAGTTVIFKNSSSQNVWTASGMHPTHQVYPVGGGCLGSAFDTCKEIEPGKDWSFKFDIAGSWGYHNHLNASHRGTIVVENP